jgi:hypothetical protein
MEFFIIFLWFFGGAVQAALYTMCFQDNEYPGATFIAFWIGAPLVSIWLASGWFFGGLWYRIEKWYADR